MRLATFDRPGNAGPGAGGGSFWMIRVFTGVSLDVGFIHRRTH
jgi:hypothetical protein